MAETKAAKKPAAKKDPFAEPERTDQQQPAEALSVEDQLKRDREKGEEIAKTHRLEEEQAKELEDVRRVHREQAERWRHHDRTEVSVVVSGVDDSGDIRVFTGDRRVHVETDGEVVLDHDGAIQIRSFLDRAFQAVS